MRTIKDVLDGLESLTRELRHLLYGDIAVEADVPIVRTARQPDAVNIKLRKAAAMLQAGKGGQGRPRGGSREGAFVDALNALRAEGKTLVSASEIAERMDIPNKSTGSIYHRLSNRPESYGLTKGGTRDLGRNRNVQLYRIGRS